MSRFRKFLTCLTLACFAVSAVFPGDVRAQSAYVLPPRIVSDVYRPVVLQGIRVDLKDPFSLEFVVDPGDIHALRTTHHALEEETSRLVKYFLAALTVPGEDLWVNLSPAEPDRIIPREFGRSAMGRDLLAQDYLLKQLTSSLLSPENEAGKKFWEKVYEKIYNVGADLRVGPNTGGHTGPPLQDAQSATHHALRTTDLVESFNKVWIVPGTADVYRSGTAAYIVDAKLKVMLESDYLSSVTGNRQPVTSKNDSDMRAGYPLPVTGYQDNVKQTIQDIILPIIENEINTGETFAPLRQIYQAVILAKWFKENLKQTLLGQEYADRNLVEGTRSQESGISKDNPDFRLLTADSSVQDIYNQYLEAFRKGAYDAIREEYDPVAQEIVARKYFTGGFTLEIPFLHYISEKPASTVVNAMMAEVHLGELESRNELTIEEKKDAVLAEIESIASNQGYLKRREWELLIHNLNNAEYRGKVHYQAARVIQTRSVPDRDISEIIAAIEPLIFSEANDGFVMNALVGFLIKLKQRILTQTDFLQIQRALFVAQKSPLKYIRAKATGLFEREEMKIRRWESMVQARQEFYEFLTRLTKGQIRDAEALSKILSISPFGLNGWRTIHKKRGARRTAEMVLDKIEQKIPGSSQRWEFDSLKGLLIKYLNAYPEVRQLKNNWYSVQDLADMLGLSSYIVMDRMSEFLKVLIERRKEVLRQVLNGIEFSEDYLTARAEYEVYHFQMGIRSSTLTTRSGLCMSPDIVEEFRERVGIRVRDKKQNPSGNRAWLANFAMMIEDVKNKNQKAEKRIEEISRGEGLLPKGQWEELIHFIQEPDYVDVVRQRAAAIFRVRTISSEDMDKFIQEASSLLLGEEDVFVLSPLVDCIVGHIIKDFNRPQFFVIMRVLNQLNQKDNVSIRSKANRSLERLQSVSQEAEESGYKNEWVTMISSRNYFYGLLGKITKYKIKNPKSLSQTISYPFIDMVGWRVFYKTEGVQNAADKILQAIEAKLPEIKNDPSYSFLRRALIDFLEKIPEAEKDKGDWFSREEMERLFYSSRASIMANMFEFRMFLIEKRKEELKRIDPLYLDNDELAQAAAEFYVFQEQIGVRNSAGHIPGLYLNPDLIEEFKDHYQLQYRTEVSEGSGDMMTLDEVRRSHYEYWKIYDRIIHFSKILSKLPVSGERGAKDGELKRLISQGMDAHIGHKINPGTGRLARGISRRFLEVMKSEGRIVPSGLTPEDLKNFWEEHEEDRFIIWRELADFRSVFYRLLKEVTMGSIAGPEDLAAEFDNDYFLVFIGWMPFPGQKEDFLEQLMEGIKKYASDDRIDEVREAAELFLLSCPAVYPNFYNWHGTQDIKSEYRLNNSLIHGQVKDYLKERLDDIYKQETMLAEVLEDKFILNEKILFEKKMGIRLSSEAGGQHALYFDNNVVDDMARRYGWTPYQDLPETAPANWFSYSFLRKYYHNRNTISEKIDSYRAHIIERLNMKYPDSENIPEFIDMNYEGKRRDERGLNTTNFYSLRMIFEMEEKEILQRRYKDQSFWKSVGQTYDFDDQKRRRVKKLFDFLIDELVGWVEARIFDEVRRRPRRETEKLSRWLVARRVMYSVKQAKYNEIFLHPRVAEVLEENGWGKESDFDANKFTEGATELAFEIMREFFPEKIKWLTPEERFLTGIFADYAVDDIAEPEIDRAMMTKGLDNGFFSTNDWPVFSGQLEEEAGYKYYYSLDGNSYIGIIKVHQQRMQFRGKNVRTGQNFSTYIKNDEYKDFLRMPWKNVLTASVLRETEPQLYSALEKAEQVWEDIQGVLFDAVKVLGEGRRQEIIGTLPFLKNGFAEMFFRWKDAGFITEHDINMLNQKVETSQLESDSDEREVSFKKVLIDSINNVIKLDPAEKNHIEEWLEYSDFAKQNVPWEDFEDYEILMTSLHPGDLILLKSGYWVRSTRFSSVIKRFFWYETRTLQYIRNLPKLPFEFLGSIPLDADVIVLEGSDLFTPEKWPEQRFGPDTEISLSVARHLLHRWNIFRDFKGRVISFSPASQKHMMVAVINLLGYEVVSRMVTVSRSGVSGYFVKNMLNGERKIDYEYLLSLEDVLGNRTEDFILGVESIVSIADSSFVVGKEGEPRPMNFSVPYHSSWNLIEGALKSFFKKNNYPYEISHNDNNNKLYLYCTDYLKIYDLLMDRYIDKRAKVERKRALVISSNAHSRLLQQAVETGSYAMWIGNDEKPFDMDQRIVALPVDFVVPPHKVLLEILWRMTEYVYYQYHADRRVKKQDNAQLVISAKENVNFFKKQSVLDSSDTTGGVDFRMDGFDVNVSGSGEGADRASLQGVRINGLHPVSITLKPLGSLAEFFAGAVPLP